MWFVEPHPFPKEDHLPNWERRNNIVTALSTEHRVTPRVSNYAVPCPESPAVHTMNSHIRGNN